MERLRLTAADDRRPGVPTLLIIDDSLAQIQNGDLPVTAMLTNGRTMRLTVVIMTQSTPTANNLGKVLRSNVNLVFVFKRQTSAAVKVAEWLPDRNAKEQFLCAVQAPATYTSVGIDVGRGELYYVRPPPGYQPRRLGAAALHGKLLPAPAPAPAQGG